MTPAPSTRLRVFVDGESGTTPAATAHVSERRGVVSTTLTYDPAWTATPGTYALSPELGLIETRHQLRAADAVGDDSADDLAAVKELPAAGSGSLGGARPKASVHDGDQLRIAKFPHRDTGSTGAERHGSATSAR